MSNLKHMTPHAPVYSNISLIAAVRLDDYFRRGENYPDREGVLSQGAMLWADDFKSHLLLDRLSMSRKRHSRFENEAEACTSSGSTKTTNLRVFNRGAKTYAQLKLAENTAR